MPLRGWIVICWFLKRIKNMSFSKKTCCCLFFNWQGQIIIWIICSEHGFINSKAGIISFVVHLRRTTCLSWVAKWSKSRLSEFKFYIMLHHIFAEPKFKIYPTNLHVNSFQGSAIPTDRSGLLTWSRCHAQSDSCICLYGGRLHAGAELDMLEKSKEKGVNHEKTIENIEKTIQKKVLSTESTVTIVEFLFGKMLL